MEWSEIFDFPFYFRSVETHMVLLIKSAVHTSAAVSRKVCGGTKVRGGTALEINERADYLARHGWREEHEMLLDTL